MLMAPGTIKWRQRLLLCGCALGAWGLVTIGAALGQSLDLDTGSATPAPAAPLASHAGGLDLDVNSAGPPASTAPPAQALPHDNAQGGTAPVAPTPAPGNAPTAEAQPAGVQPAPAEPPPAAPATAAVVAPRPEASQPAATATAAPPPEPVSLDHPTVLDTATLKAGDTTVTLYGIDGVQGQMAQGLQGFLDSTDHHLNCQAESSAGFVCLLSDGTDVAQVALVNGAARSKEDAPEAYHEQEAAAQAARRGIWANLPPPPVTVKHPMVQDTATLMADDQVFVLDGMQGLGQPYIGQLQGYIAANGDSLTCNSKGMAGSYICVTADGTDLAKVALVNGAAVVAPDAPDSYRLQQADALNNRRGIWVDPPANLLMMTAASQDAAEYVLVAGDDGADGITYIGGEPMAVIGGESVFLVYGDDAGWGYYDHYHHWHGAPDRYRRHMDHFHAGGHGLRGYGHDAVMRREAVMHREAMAGHPGMAGAGGFHPGMAGPGGMRPGMAGPAGMRPGMAGPGGMRPGMAEPAGMRPGMAGPGGMRPGMAGPAGMRPGMAEPAGMRPGMAGPAGMRPGMAGPAGGFRPGGMPGGFARPNPMASAGGFHPGGGAPAMHAAAPAMHPSSGGGGGKKK
jgi:hypothetical protein